MAGGDRSSPLPEAGAYSLPTIDSSRTEGASPETHSDLPTSLRSVSALVNTTPAIDLTLLRNGDRLLRGAPVS